MKIILILVVIAVAVISSAKCIKSEKKADFGAYLRASENVISGRNIYTDHQERLPYLYAPFFSVLLTPLTLIDVNIVLAVWIFLNAFLSLLIFYRFFEMISEKKFALFDARKRCLMAFFVVLFSFRLIQNNLEYAQINFFIIFLLILAERYSEMKKTVSGVLLGFCVFLKAVLFPFALMYLLRRKTRIIIVSILSCIALAALPALFFGIDKNFEYLNDFVEKVLVKRSEQNPSEAFNASNVSLQITIQKVFSGAIAFQHNGKNYYFTLFELPDSALKLIPVVVALVFTFVLIFYWKKYRNSSQSVSRYGLFSLACCCSVLASPVVQGHYYSILFPAIIYVAYNQHFVLTKDKPLKYLYFTGVAIVVLTSYEITRGFIYNALSYGSILAIPALLLGISIFRIAKLTDTGIIRRASKQYSQLSSGMAQQSLF